MSRAHPLVTVSVVAMAALVLGFVGASCGGESKKPGSCKSTKDCKEGQVCDQNKCVECVTDDQCPKGNKCSANACVAAPDCTKDGPTDPTAKPAEGQCPPGKVCQAGKCKSCATDNDCGTGGSCQAGTCQAAKKCAKDEDCADDEDCVGGFCRKATGGSTPPDVTCTLATVYFGFDQSTIMSSERDRLDANAQCLEKSKGKSIYLIGHTDTSGTEEYNIALSERRAQSVADYMARLGSDPARMQIVPKGETEPTGLGDDKDRRCDFQWK